MKELNEIIQELDNLPKGENPLVKFSIYGGGPDESAFEGNRAGLREMAIQLLKLGGLSQDERDEALKIEEAFMAICHEDSDIAFDYLAVNEELVPVSEGHENNEGGFTDKVVPILIFSGLATVPIFYVIGIVSLVRWFF